MALLLRESRPVGSFFHRWSTHKTPDSISPVNSRPYIVSWDINLLYSYGMPAPQIHLLSTPGSKEANRYQNATHHCLEQVAEANKGFTNKHRSGTRQINLEDRVWLATGNIVGLPECKKHSDHYIGPYMILQRINEVTYK